MNFSEILLVLAPHQFSQLHKTSSKTSFTTPTEISPCGSLAVASSNLQVTNSSTQTNSNVIEDSVTEDNNHKIPHSRDSKNEGGYYNDPEMTLGLIMSGEHIVAQPLQAKEPRSINEIDLLEKDKHTIIPEDVEDNNSITNYSAWFIVMLCLLLCLLYIAYGNNYFTSDHR